MSPSPSIALLLAAAQIAPAASQPPETRRPAAQPPAAHPPAPSPSGGAETPGVTVTVHRPVVVTAAQACPEPDPARNPADRDPAVTDSYPRDGATVRPGLLQVRVSFDARMSCYAEVSSQGGDTDPCEAQGSWVLPDRKSFLMQCRLQPGVAYTLRFQKADARGFVGMSGRPAAPYVLRFTALAGPPVATWADAQRDDPGPPDADRANAYVICTDATPALPNGDCRRQRFASPAPSAPAPP